MSILLAPKNRNQNFVHRIEWRNFHAKIHTGRRGLESWAQRFVKGERESFGKLTKRERERERAGEAVYCRSYFSFLWLGGQLNARSILTACA